MKKVSIIVPIYNTKEFLPQVFDSLLSQSYSNIEIIAVDDGSTDGSTDVCREYAEKDGRIRFYPIENTGVSGARNFGLDKVTGDYVMFLDSDDKYIADAVEKLVEAAGSSEADIVSAGIIKTDGASEHKIGCTKYSEDVEGDELYSVLESACFGWDAALCSFIDKLYRADFIREHKLCFPNLRSGEDTVFALETMICASKIYFLNDHYFYKYVINDNSFTQKKLSVEQRIEFSNQFFAECERVIEKYGMTFLKRSFTGRKALAVYDFVMNSVSRTDLTKTQRIDFLKRICEEKYYLDITDKEIFKTHSFRVRKTVLLAAKGRINGLYRFASFLQLIKKIRSYI